MRIEKRYKEVIDWFQKEMPSASTELIYHNPFELLIAVILSAQCTDKRVNATTPALFEEYPNALAMSKASTDDILDFISTISYYNSKSRYLRETAIKIHNDFNDEVPKDMKLLLTLPGVGRKTANVIRGIIFNVPSMPVDTHVFRVSNRIGLVKNSKTPLETETQLVKHIPKDLLIFMHHCLVLHGRYVCLARKPKCDECGLVDYCAYYSKKSKAKLAKQKSKKQKSKISTTSKSQI